MFRLYILASMAMLFASTFVPVFLLSVFLHGFFSSAGSGYCSACRVSSIPWDVQGCHLVPPSLPRQWVCSWGFVQGVAMGTAGSSSSSAEQVEVVVSDPCTTEPGGKEEFSPRCLWGLCFGNPLCVLAVKHFAVGGYTNTLPCSFFPPSWSWAQLWLSFGRWSQPAVFAQSLLNQELIGLQKNLCKPKGVKSVLWNQSLYFNLVSTVLSLSFFYCQRELSCQKNKSGKTSVLWEW